MNECNSLGPLYSVKEQKEISTVFYPKKACLDFTKKEYAVHSGQAAGLQWALPDSGVRRAPPAACLERRHLSTTDDPLIACRIPESGAPQIFLKNRVWSIML